VEAPEQSHEEEWRALLTGEVRGVNTIRAVMRRIPAEPRCKLCASPFGRPGGLVLPLAGFSQSRLNRRLCRKCIRSLERTPGGAEIELSLMFADVRGSTAIAERIEAQEFSRLIARFYGTAAKVVDRWDGIVDKFVGDEVVALFIPGFAGADHASKAIEAARELLAETCHGTAEPWLPIGAGVHTGVAYVGAIGEGDASDFTAVGDSVNTTARLAAAARFGEILVSSAAAESSALATGALEARTLELRGREETVETWVISA
jgi:adenylate cyclase